MSTAQLEHRTGDAAAGGHHPARASITEVARSLFVGADPAEATRMLFAAMNLDLIVALTTFDDITSDASVYGLVPPEGKALVRLPLPDGDRVFSLTEPMTAAVIRMAAQVLADGGRVLVHCREGINRSVRVAAEIIRIGAADRPTYEEALMQVTRARVDHFLASEACPLDEPWSKGWVCPKFDECPRPSRQTVACLGSLV